MLSFQSALFLWTLLKKAGKFFVVSTLDVTKNKLLNIDETKRKRKKRGVFVGGEKQEDKRDDDQ